MDLMTVYGFAHRELTMVPVPLHLPSQQRPGEPSGWHELGLSVELLMARPYSAACSCFTS